MESSRRVSIVVPDAGKPAENPRRVSITVPNSRTGSITWEAFDRTRRASRGKLHGYTQEKPGMGEYLCIGDYISLYCEETEGYVYSGQSSSSNNGLFVYINQERNRPKNIPNQHAVVFQICIQNRYKLNKKYRKWQNADNRENTSTESPAVAKHGLALQARLAAEAENKDNEAEQARQYGKRVRYGEVVQLKHIFTGKFVHMSTTQTSQKDKNNMKVSLHEFNAKNAQFRILPRYKVKSEGEVVQLFDQIVFESVKSHGHYFHASESFQIDHFTFGSELNLGVERSSFTLIGCYREHADQERFVRGGSVIRLFHKELEAYLVAEGLFDDCITEDVHFRIRVIDQHRPKSLSASTSGITYWQIEAEHSILDGDVIRWEQQIRLRHLLTRQYLCIDSKMDVSLVNDASDPRTVFRLHSVLKERDEIQFESYARIEHMLTGCWLHALKDEDYERRGMEDNGERSMQGLRWDTASVRKVSASSESMYDDAYTIQEVVKLDTSNFNFVAGMVPFLFNLIQDLQLATQLNAKKTHGIIVALQELKNFMVPQGQPDKNRQKLMRNLRVIDILVNLLQCRLREGDEESHMIRIFKEAYDVLHAYMIGKSRKNALYFAKYIDFFQTQFTQKGGIGLNVAQMIVELIRDKRKIVDRITKKHIDTFIQLLIKNHNYRFLDLLQVLCVCDGVAIPNNQSYIVEQWLRKYKTSVYMMDRGQNINKRPNIVYVSTDGAKGWVPLNVFVDTEGPDFVEDDYKFLLHQLDLFKALCFGRNDFAGFVITREYGYLTWEDAYLCMTAEQLPDIIRAKYCELIIGLFVDVGNNYSVLDHPNICFVYEYVGSKDAKVEHSQYVVMDLVTIFPVLRDWLAEFLRQNCQMTASEIGHNLLIEQVLRLLQHLVKFGYYLDIDDVKQLLTPLLSLLDGTHDVPFPKDKGKGYTKDSQKLVTQYRNKGRFDQSKENEAIVNAKYRAMEVLDFLLTFQRNLRLKAFVTKFKQCEQNQGHRTLEPLMYESFNPHDQSNMIQPGCCRRREADKVMDHTNIDEKVVRHQKQVLKELKEMVSSSSIFDIESTTSVLKDLSMYSYDKMVTKSLDILNKLYSSQSDMFQLASKAQILLTHDSAKVHREVQRSLPVLRRLAKQKLNDEQVTLTGEILDELAGFCHLPKNIEEPHFMNQNILVSHGVLPAILDILSQEIDAKLVDQQYKGMKKIFKKTLDLLALITRENSAMQEAMFNNLDTLLEVQIVPSCLALALKELFIANQTTCLKVHSKQVQKIVLLAAQYQNEAPEFLELLKVLVKVEGLDLTIKRNQALVMKYIMQNFRKAAYVLDQPRDSREQILTNKRDPGHLAYFISLVDLLATCAEGENKFIESLCQTIMPVEEILWVLNHRDIDGNLKQPFVKYMLWVYLKPAGNLVESGAADLQHDKEMWNFVASAAETIKQLSDTITKHRDRVALLLRQPPGKSAVAVAGDTKATLHGCIFYVLEAVLPFVEVFYSMFYSPDKDLYPGEMDTTETLAGGLSSFCEVVGQFLTNPVHMKAIAASITILISVSTTNKSLYISVLEKFSTEMRLGDTKSAVRKGNMEYYAGELELNAKFHTFAKNNNIIYQGYNTVAAQIKFKKSKREYTALGTNEELLLGEEFQSLVKCFIDVHERKPAKRFLPAKKLLEQLQISQESIRQGLAHTEELDIKCMQILRAIIHNEERKLPEDWDTRAADQKIKKQLLYIKEVQNAVNVHGFVEKVLPHVARRSDLIAREVLAFMSLMLFNANRDVQKSMLDFFLSTREEVFFMAVRDRMQISTNSIKEKFLMARKCRRLQGRSLLAQHQARVKEAFNNMGSFNASLTVGRKALQLIQDYELRLKDEKMQGWSALSRAKEPPHDQKRRSKKRKTKQQESFKKSKKIGVIPNGLSHDHSVIRDNSHEALLKPAPESQDITPEVELSSVNVESMKTVENMVSNIDEGVVEMLEYKDDGYIELVLKLLARLCDGQHNGLQNYMREQPDNVKSFNIVGETAQFLNVVYSTINSKTIDLIIQVFSTLNEFCSGNQENRFVIYDRKVVDYINFILRAGEIADCEPEKILDLRQAIASLVVALIEENGPGKSQVAKQGKADELRYIHKEVKDTLDKNALYRCMTQCYEMHQADKPKLDDVLNSGPQGSTSYLKSAKSIAAFGGNFISGVMAGKKENASTKEMLMEVGFTFYLILARMIDIDPTMPEKVDISPEQRRAFDFYKKNSMSIEIVKDDILQKVNFRVKNKNYLRDEVKEKLKWNVDRTSPSNKIRDLMSWTRDIMKDISYQRRILHNPIAMLFTKGWLLWNYGATFLSVAINLLMLLTWNNKATQEDYAKLAEYGSTPAPSPDSSTGSTQPPFNWDVFKDPVPKISGIPTETYTILMYALGGTHNLFSVFVLISYFLSNHPSLPTCKEITDLIRGWFGKKEEVDDSGEQKKEEGSKLEVKFLSFTTFYYVVFLAMSVMGTLFHGYFFAFHLLNIVNNNQLLSGVIKAVTQNGISLLWVAILGMIVIYIYALVGFALLREFFTPGDYLYCTNLWQCTITVMRYGLIGDMFETIHQTELRNSFEYFWPLVLYHVSFFIFITTIGLNIIFGIIVDTFSELRDLKWRTESDMKDTCFICSRNSYDFEHTGKGFDHHVRNEHNMWAYVFFLIHLDDVKTSDYTAMELYVCKLVEEENYDFFPMNRALCLSSIDVDSTESKIDELLQQVTTIANKQKQEEADKKRKVEKLKQKRWQEKHRQFMFGISTEDIHREGDTDTLLGVPLGLQPMRQRSRPSSIVEAPVASRPPPRQGISGLQTSPDRSDFSDLPPPPPPIIKKPDSLQTVPEGLFAPGMSLTVEGQRRVFGDTSEEEERGSDSDSMDSLDGEFTLAQDDPPSPPSTPPRAPRNRALSVPKVKTPSQIDDDSEDDGTRC
ncbi:inositol 1,4,5-trisphosphate receptor type 1-like [Ylistrum balloti]|uniref:inositol 1,4,5-trisphosphate receptor type 1-like n=1 Tax=Ylistrum balloti TaxID=509963 RepID=UPI002905A27E|nr:inositol 1,4,5-trisphosphate receptor type 1-like [Ylistrum balloti]